MNVSPTPPPYNDDSESTTLRVKKSCSMKKHHAQGAYQWSNLFCTLSIFNSGETENGGVEYIEYLNICACISQ